MYSTTSATVLLRFRNSENFPELGSTLSQNEKWQTLLRTPKTLLRK